MAGILSDIFGGGAVADLVGKVIDKIFPDPIEAEKARIRLAELSQQGALAELQSETQLLQGQIDINKIDASSGDKYQSRWRPTVGWVCTVGLAYQTIIRDLMDWTARVAGYPGDFPSMDTATLVGLLIALLGVGAMRSVDIRARGAAR